MVVIIYNNVLLNSSNYSWGGSVIRPFSYFELCYSYPYPCPEKLYELHTVPICYVEMLCKLAWAWAWV